MYIIYFLSKYLLFKKAVEILDKVLYWKWIATKWGRSAVQVWKSKDDFERHCVSVPSATRPGRPVGPGAGCCWNQRGGVPSTSLQPEPYAFSRLSALTATRADWDSVNWVSSSPKTRLNASGAGPSVTLSRRNSSNNSNNNERRRREKRGLQFYNYNYNYHVLGNSRK